MYGILKEVPIMVDENILIENAILAFLHHYPDHKWAVPYAELLTKLRALKYEQPKPTKTQTRGRPAKRQRKAKAPSDTPSESKDESVKT